MPTYDVIAYPYGFDEKPHKAVFHDIDEAQDYYDSLNEKVYHMRYLSQRIKSGQVINSKWMG